MFRIKVWDNFHYTDDDEATLKAEQFATAEEAIAEAKRIVDESCRKEGFDYERYTSFGEDPSVFEEGSGLTCDFSAWKHAEALCKAREETLHQADVARDEEAFASEPLIALQRIDADLLVRVQKAVRVVLKRDLPSEDTVRLGLLLNAIERLPLAPEGIGIDLTLTYTFNKQSRYFDLRLDARSLRMGSGGIAHTEGIGSDNFSENVFEAEVGGFRQSADLMVLASWSDELMEAAGDDSYRVDVANDGEDSLRREEADIEALWNSLPEDGEDL